MTDTRTWRYRRGEDGKIEDRLFPSPEDVPEGEGWVESPADLEPDETPREMGPLTGPPKRKPGRPRGSKNRPKAPPEEQSASLGV